MGRRVTDKGSFIIQIFLFPKGLNGNHLQVHRLESLYK